MYYETGNLKNLFSVMKREGWTPSFINKKVEDYLKDLENKNLSEEKLADFFYKTSRKGKWNAGDKKPAYQDEVERMEKLRAAVNEFDRFQELMRKKDLYDFDDMINWVIKAFEENKQLLASYQETFFNIFLVDEYQDTSGTQKQAGSASYQLLGSAEYFCCG